MCLRRKVKKSEESERVRESEREREREKSSKSSQKAQKRREMYGDFWVKVFFLVNIKIKARLLRVVKLISQSSPKHHTRRTQLHHQISCINNVCGWD